jgi:hypothetical protein
MTEFGPLRASAVEMGLISLRFVEECQVRGCWPSSRVLAVLWLRPGPSFFRPR